MSVLTCKITSKDIKDIYEILTRKKLAGDGRHLHPEHTKDFCDYLHRKLQINPSFEEYIKGYQITGMYGHGAYGVVLQMCKSSNPKDCRALKVMLDPGSDSERQKVIRELKFQEALAKSNIAPEVAPDVGRAVLSLHTDFDEKKAEVKVPIVLLRMQPIDYTFRQIILMDKWSTAEFVFPLLSLLRYKMLTHVVHGDFHLGNVAVAGPQVMLIDFGMARVVLDDAEHFVDFIPLIGNLMVISKDKRQSASVRSVSANSAEVLMYACNYLFHTKFTSTENFLPLKRGGFGYYISAGILRGAIILSYQYLNQSIFMLKKRYNPLESGFIDLDKRASNVTIDQFKAWWPVVSPSDEDNKKEEEGGEWQQLLDAVDTDKKLNFTKDIVTWNVIPLEEERVERGEDQWVEVESKENTTSAFRVGGKQETHRDTQ